LFSGVRIDNGAQNNTIGGTVPDTRNVISGNGTGVRIFQSGTTGNIVSGNYIGTDKDGTTDLGNANGGEGVYISGDDVRNNTISGNYIGTDESGTTDLGNSGGGVYIQNAQNNTVGGDTAGKRNVIAGNGSSGVFIVGSDAMSNTISGNYIGTDKDGTTALGNSNNGVGIIGAQNNTVGGDTAGERNVISGNDSSGVDIGNGASNTISGNYIGTDKDGAADLGNTFWGLYVSNGAQNNTVGPGNVIAHNGRDGVEVDGSSTSGNTITQNSIFSNTLGIDLVSGASGGIDAPTIMTTTVGSVNIIGEDACPYCTVELFGNGDSDGEGETYVGDTIADGSGNFTITVSALSQPFLTATATDETDGTSEFSDVFEMTVSLAPPVGPVFLPIVVKNH
jgi:titin